MFAYNLLAGFLRGIGNSFMPLVFLIISSLTNILLDLLFITRFQMGIRGAAVATVIAQGFSVILCLIYIIRKTPILVPERQHFAVGKKLYRELTTQGLSMGFMNAVVSSGTVILQSAINGLGEMYIACHATARKLNSFCLMPVSTIGASMSTFVSQKQRPDPQGYTHCLYHGCLLGCYSDNHSLSLRSKSGYTVRLHTGCDSG
jgi:Na+-driven multidrug efflux pump